MIVLCTDFGPGPYTGQMQAVLAQQAPGVAVINLFDNLPCWDIQAAAYLLPAYVGEFPAESIFVCVVDPGVGSHAREPVIARIDDRWYIGPGNGLFHILSRRAHATRFWRIDWQPEHLSASFHGRDLFAPTAARLATGALPVGVPFTEPQPEGDWPDDLYRIIYIDHYGNAISGMRAGLLEPTQKLKVGKHLLSRARTFSDVGEGEAFWYENANGLVEIAVNRGRADDLAGLQLGSAIQLV